jgi:hypothetical protein
MKNVNSKETKQVVHYDYQNFDEGVVFLSSIGIGRFKRGMVMIDPEDKDAPRQIVSFNLKDCDKERLFDLWDRELHKSTQEDLMNYIDCLKEEIDSLREENENLEECNSALLERIEWFEKMLYQVNLEENEDLEDDEDYVEGRF